MNKLQVEIDKVKKQIFKVVKKKHPKTDRVSISVTTLKSGAIGIVVHPWEGSELPNSYYPPSNSTINQVKNYIRFNDHF